MTKIFLYFKLFSLSILGALTLSLVSLYCLVRISDIVVEDYRYGYLLYVARAIEKSNDFEPVSKINVNKVNAPEIDNRKLNLLEITEFGPSLDIENEKRPKPSLWFVRKDGKILSSTVQAPLPIEWKRLRKPKKIHGIEKNEERFGFDPKTFVVKLDTTPVTYLVSHNEKTLFQAPFLIIQGAHTFTTAALAVFLALSITFYYFRRKSIEARKVLSKLESGDLKARFEINRFDEFGSLILDFNRMAHEIERLVMRLRETEVSRSHLLQELGHDLRTPLTSLSTAFETMRFHHENLSQEDKNEIFAMISTDINYFKELLDKLTLIATIDGPHYKSTTEEINICELIESEILSRQIGSGSSLKWKFGHDLSARPVVLGDAHLIKRLFRNALDNASRYAADVITVNIQQAKDKIEVFVMDDGPGLSEEALKSFGKRRERRLRKEKDENDYSLGLGSVIMKTIAQVHDGQVEIMNILQGGACLKITLNSFIKKESNSEFLNPINKMTKERLKYT